MWQTGEGRRERKGDRASGTSCTKNSKWNTTERENNDFLRLKKKRKIATLTHAVTRVTPSRERRGFKMAEPEPPADGSPGSAVRVWRRKVGMQGTPLDTRHGGCSTLTEPRGEGGVKET